MRGALILPQGDALLEEVGRFVGQAAAASMPTLSARWSERLEAFAAGATWESLAAAGDESVAMAIAGARVFEVDATG